MCDMEPPAATPPQEGHAGPAPHRPTNPWPRIALVALIVIASVATTFAVAAQLRSDNRAAALPTTDPLTGIALSQTVAHTHDLAIQYPEGFRLHVEIWEAQRMAHGVYNEELEQRQQLFFYRETEDLGDAATECTNDMGALGASMVSEAARVDPEPIEDGLDVGTAAHCMISGTLDDGEQFTYTYRIFTPDGGPVVAIQTRTALGRESNLHTDIETYFTCIAADAAGVALSACQSG